MASRRRLASVLLALAGLSLLPAVQAATVEESVTELQQAWEVINYKTPAAEKVASVISEAAEAVKTVIADTDDVQEHNEL